MSYLPNDINVLRENLFKKREDLSKARRAYDYFVNVQKSELYDKFVAAPLEEAKSSGKTKEQIEQIRSIGLIKFNAEFEKDMKKKARDLKIREINKEIKNIKIRMLELNPESLNSDESSTKNSIKNAQNKFELGFN